MNAGAAEDLLHFNGDTVPDLVTANSGSHDVSVRLGNGDVTFQVPISFSTPGDRRRLPARALATRSCAE